MTVQSALLQGADILIKQTVPVPRLTSEVLLAHAMHCDRSYLYAHGTDTMTELAWIHFGRYLNERLNGRPTQYIIHRQEFYGRDFYVDERVLIPRPETEHLVERAIEILRRDPAIRALDVGTGSGAIAISVALETKVRLCASDISTEALAVAARNRQSLDAPIDFFAGDLLEAVVPGSIGLLLSNPPYVPGEDRANMQSEVRDWEPHVALFAGDTGFEIYRRLIDSATQIVKPGGRILMELGYRALDGVREMLAVHWSGTEVVFDLAGLPRVIEAIRV